MIIYMEIFKNILESMFRLDSIWSVVIRAVIWFVVAIVVIVSVDNPNSDKSLKDLRSNLGFLVMFIVLSGGLVYLLFGYQVV
ncbi:MAG: hypothetical protein GW754_01190 [Candidatus Pacebacteria bacterium]|nr:hypothetical protein [Candidatus Paceibacterota bacterium]NCS86799.1 hypothetical protein [Candidatus Paceibacterota bacterium]